MDTLKSIINFDASSKRVFLALKNSEFGLIKNDSFDWKIPDICTANGFLIAE